MPLQNDSGSRANIGRLSVLQNSENNIKSSTGRLSVSQNSDSALKETKSTTCMSLIFSVFTRLYSVETLDMPNVSFIYLFLPY